ncbi:cyclophilin-like fold protein [Ferroglobus sp.]|uniref:cyclophilin-like fold protein n=1 Tax=Ferroglobus sp. TaxID=2614230 RepID=UPI0025B83FD1|nr:cyclophilin-like fold protein [Ferroglobus sp.]
MKVKIKVGKVEVTAELNESIAPKTVEAIKKALPIKSKANRWGDEVYFHTNVNVSVEENSKEVVEVGDVAYWIPGKAICLFFGKTPISDDKIRPASAVNVIGKILDDPTVLREVKDGDEVTVFEVESQ